jgi:DNA polymerase
MDLRQSALDLSPRTAEKEALMHDTRSEAAGCQACPLWEGAKQTVFGDGPATARLVLIAEAPGHHEDLHGVPFVGPAGRLLEETLAQAGLRREEIYITNVVKHRPWIQSGDLKKNRAPKISEIKACAPWLTKELEIIRPQIIGCLGAPSARWILGRDFKLTQQRGQWFDSQWAPNVLATIHPAYVLIQPDDWLRHWREILFADFRMLAERYRELQAAPAA